ncbi:MAG: sulfite reductase subunit alpha [Planctomycetes bacterium]|nr:sulfite reductase subunit alpha [Planctomycetota bacterium]
MAIPVLPESAPFTSAQRAWLNGFFAGMLGLDRGGVHSNGHGAVTTGGHRPVVAAPAAEEPFPWHDPALSMAERLQLAEGKPFERVLMAAMAQLDCGACGYQCQTYAEAIASGQETDLTKCAPGGKDTARKLKELVTGRKSLPQVATNGHSATNGHGAANGSTVQVHGATSPAAVLPPKPIPSDRKNPYPAPLLKCHPLTRNGSEKDVRFVAINLKGSGLTYEVGDALGVYPENCPDFVETILRALGARGDELVTTPDGRTVLSYDALVRDYTITRINERFAALLAESATDPSEASTLKALLDNDPAGVLEWWDVLDLLEQFPSARPPVPEMVAALAPLQPRLYSISSSLKTHPEEVHLTVGVVRYTKASRMRKGVASTFLTELVRPRQRVKVFVHPSHGFRPPADGDTPIIMVGPGTGIAPFRAFLEERAAVGARGKSWLLFGDQRREFDFLYREELEGYLKQGTLTRLDTAFSRDQPQKVYVQHRMRENGAELWAWLQQGAHFYVCGDARRMALDVDHALHAIVEEQGEMSAEAAKEYVKELSKAKRYQRDVY